MALDEITKVAPVSLETFIGTGLVEMLATDLVIETGW